MLANVGNITISNNCPVQTGSDAQKTIRKRSLLPSPGGLWLCLCTSVGLWARRLPGKGRAAPAVQAGGTAAGGDVAAVTAAGG